MNRNKKTSNKAKKITNGDKRILVFTGCCVLAFVLLYTVPMISNPIRRPNPMPRNYVLNLTPLGTQMDDVANIVEGHRGWIIENILNERGFVHPRPNTLRPIPEERPVIIGEQSIRVRAPAYRPFGLLSRTAVAIFYAFDSNGYLIDVFVWRSTAS